MGTGRHRLTATAIRAAKPGTYQDGAGLMLLKREEGGSWVWRYQRDGRRRDMGLGRWPDLSLAEARKARDRWAEVLASGRDPIAEREREKAEALAAEAQADPTLAEAVDEAFAAIAVTLRDGGARGRWRSPLDTHVLPKLGSRRLSTLGAADLVDALRPIWRTRHPTAEKAVQRLGIVWRRQSLAGHVADAMMVDRARLLLGEVRHVAEPIRATPWQEVPALYARLGLATTHLCLRLAILTATRSDAARGLRFSEVSGDVWTVPPERVKAREGKARPFRVPLVAEALEVLARAQEVTAGDVAFASITGRPVTTRGLEKALDDLGEPGRPHGFRTSFRTWAQDHPHLCSWEVAETALGHAVGGQVERSYARSDLLDQRRAAMEAWAAWVTTPPAA